jgi:hypothetical protein
MKWQKTIIWIMASLILIQFAISIPECQRQTKATDIPCNIISSWDPGTCSNYNISIYNTSGVIMNVTWQDYNIVCSGLFNISVPGSYNYNSSIESGIITVVGDDEMILTLLLIPVAVMFFFLYYGHTLEEGQEPLKWFFRLLALLMLIVIFGGANIAISMNPAYTNFLSLYDMGVVGMIVWGMIGLMMVYVIYKIFASFREKKEDDILYGRI